MADPNDDAPPPPAYIATMHSFTKERYLKTLQVLSYVVGLASTAQSANLLQSLKRADDGQALARLVGVSSLAEFLVGPLVGRASDTWGRTRAIQFCLALMIASRSTAGAARLLEAAAPQWFAKAATASWQLDELVSLTMVGCLASVCRASVADFAQSEQDVVVGSSRLALAGMVGAAAGPLLGGVFGTRVKEFLVSQMCLTGALMAASSLFEALDEDGKRAINKIESGPAREVNGDATLMKWTPLAPLRYFETKESSVDMVASLAGAASSGVLVSHALDQFLKSEWSSSKAMSEMSGATGAVLLGATAWTFAAEKFGLSRTSKLATALRSVSSIGLATTLSTGAVSNRQQELFVVVFLSVLLASASARSCDVPEARVLLSQPDKGQAAAGLANWRGFGVFLGSVACGAAAERAGGSSRGVFVGLAAATLLAELAARRRAKRVSKDE